MLGRHGAADGAPAPACWRTGTASGAAARRDRPGSDAARGGHASGWGGCVGGNGGTLCGRSVSGAATLARWRLWCAAQRVRVCLGWCGFPLRPRAECARLAVVVFTPSFCPCTLYGRCCCPVITNNIFPPPRSPFQDLTGRRQGVGVGTTLARMRCGISPCRPVAARIGRRALRALVLSIATGKPRDAGAGAGGSVPEPTPSPPFRRRCRRRAAPPLLCAADAHHCCCRGAAVCGRWGLFGRRW